MRLTATAIRNAKPGHKSVRMFDGGGLYLEISPRGGKWWRLKYRFDGKEKRISFGVFPDVGLKVARERRDAARKLLAEGIDPGAERKARKDARVDQLANSFESIAREWFGKFSVRWAPAYGAKVIGCLERDVFPWLGALPVRDISAPTLLGVLRRIESRGALDTAHFAREKCGQIFRYAVATGRGDRDPSADLKGALPPTKTVHHASITDPKAIGDLLRAIDGYCGTLIARNALRLAPLVFVRPGELRHADWSEIDLGAAEWRIPAEKMKMRSPHVVPLSTQAVEILEELFPLTGPTGFVFPSVRSRKRPMSENTVNAALRRLGYTKEQMTGHGFRSMASTLLNEQGWNRDAIERQLAHAERNSIRAAYNYAEHLPERRRMMQAWADYLDGLRKGAVVIPLRRGD